MSKQPEIVANRTRSQANPPEEIGEQTVQEIRERAYQLFEQRGAEHGHDVEDWLKAEAEIVQRSSLQSAA